jgi:hypothetical protein
MIRIVVIALVVALLLPGLAMLFAVVLRYLLRGTRSKPRSDDGKGQARAGP